jgi:alpha-1,2-mannosyltransferase
VIVCLFIFIYAPFLYQQGYKRAFENPGDFPTLYWGPKLAFVEHRSPYVGGAFTEAEAEVNRHVFPYLYPPPSLLAFYPLSLVSYDAAKVCLISINHVCFLVIIYLLFFRIAPFGPPLTWSGLTAALMTVYVLTYYPVIDNFAWGQINLIVLALLCFAWLAFKKGGHALSIAVPLSLAILLKTYPVLLLPLLVVKKRFHAAAVVVALLCVYAFVAWNVLPRGLWGDWVINVMPTGGYGQRPFNLFLPVEPWNHSINGFFLFLQDRYPVLAGFSTGLITKPLSYLLAASVAAITVGLSYFSTRRGSGEKVLDIEVSLFLLMIFLVAPLSWEHHLVYVLPAALFAIYFLLAGDTRRTTALLVIASLFVIAWDFPRDDMFLFTGLWALTNAIKFFAVFALWVFVAAKLWDRLRDSPAVSPATGAA